MSRSLGAQSSGAAESPGPPGPPGPPHIEVAVFDVGAEHVVGHLHRPSAPPPWPAVIVAGPMTSVKEQVTGTYASALARCGIAALAIDHRHFGESGAWPRQYEHHERKREDLKAAVDWLASHRQIDPAALGAVGICLGAGYAASVVAIDRRLQALVGIAGYYRDPAAMRQADPTGFDAKVQQGRDARRHLEISGEVLTIPAASSAGDAAMQTADTVDYYTRRAAHPNYCNAFALMSREHFLPFDVQALAPRITVPTLMVHAERALSPAWARRFADALCGPVSALWVESAGQTDFYDNPDLVGIASTAAAQHLFRHCVAGQKGLAKT